MSHCKQDIIKNANHAHLSRYNSKSTSASKPTGATDALLQLLNLLNLGSDDPLKDQLGNPVTLLNFVVRVGVVEEQDLDLAAVISVDDARTGVNEVLGRKARPRRNTAVYTPPEAVSLHLVKEFASTE